MTAYDWIALGFLLVQGIIQGLFLMTFLKPRFSWRTPLYVGLLQNIIGVICCWILQTGFLDPNPAKSFVLGLAGFVIMVLCYRGSMKMRIVGATVSYILMILTDVTNFAVMAYLYKWDFIHDVTSISQKEYIYISCSFVILQLAIFALAALIIRVFRSRTGTDFRGISTKELLLFSLFPFNQLLLVQYFYGTVLAAGGSVKTHPMLLIAAVFCIVVDIFMYRLVRQAGEKKLAEERAFFYEKQMSMQNDYYKAFCEFDEKLRKLRHDVGNQLQTMNALVEQHEYEAARRISDDIGSHISTLSQMRFCQNKMINALLYVKYKTMTERNIVFDHNITLDGNSKYEDIDLCKIVSNLLDNAIEATTATKKPYIQMTACNVQGHLLISCRNSFSGSLLKKKNGDIISKKGAEHGNGLKIICQTAEKYHGDVLITTPTDVTDLSTPDRYFEVQVALEN